MKSLSLDGPWRVSRKRILEQMKVGVENSLPKPNMTMQLMMDLGCETPSGDQKRLCDRVR